MLGFSRDHDQRRKGALDTSLALVASRGKIVLVP